MRFDTEDEMNEWYDRLERKWLEREERQLTQFDEEKENEN